MAVGKKQEPQEVPGVSFKLGSFTGGGAIPEGDYLLQKHEIVLWDYDGRMQGNTLAMRLAAVALINGKPEGDALIQHYSVGDPTAFGPNSKGTGIVALAKRVSLGKGSNFFIYLENLVNSGFPEDQFDNDVSIFDGTFAHITHIPAPERNLPKSNLVATANPQQQRDRVIPVVSAVIKLPWEKTARRTAPATAPAKAASKAPPARAAEAEADAAGPSDVLLEHLSVILKNVTEMPRTQARVQAFKSMNAAGIDASIRDEALRLFNDENAIGDVLAGIGDGFALEGASIKAVG